MNIAIAIVSSTAFVFLLGYTIHRTLYFYQLKRSIRSAARGCALFAIIFGLETRTAEEHARQDFAKMKRKAKENGINLNRIKHIKALEKLFVKEFTKTVRERK